MVTSQRSLATAASHLDRRQTSHKAGLVGLNGEAGAAEDGDPAGSKQPRPVGEVDDCPKWWQRADKRNVVILLTSGDSIGGKDFDGVRTDRDAHRGTRDSDSQSIKSLDG